ncbi:Uncharacterised protein [Vibrio cholerae]|nr:Uncharacterised protein [Vibrio cholerae]CSC02720.1 Uncharacterised protein [Vibrio cholerae]
MLFLVVRQKIATTMDDRASRHHFGVQQSLRREQTVEITAVAVGPIEHWSN